VQPALDSSGVVYEVNLEADAQIAAPFDTWLRDHIADMLQFDGFRSAEILEDAAAPPGRIRRVVQYRLRDRAALDEYLAVHAPRMQSQGVARFGDRYSAARRVLPHREEFVRGAVSTENCLNCGEVLTGQHCSHCGQPARVRVLSLWGLVKDVVGDLLDADSRVWRTLWPLAFRPGLLTQEFLRGRRASYTPPFRMYLVLSVVFFVLASVGDPGSEVAVQVDENGANIQLREGGAAPGDAPASEAATQRGSPATPAATPAPVAPAAHVPVLDAETRRLVEQLVKRVPAEARKDLRAELETSLAAATPEERAATARLIADPCGEESLNVQLGPVLEQYEPRLRDACRKIVADQQSFGRALFENIPKMMFIFLPLIALAMAVLYLRSGRYYVEHLLFVVHFHAFFFLAGIAVLLLERLSALTSGSLSTGLTAAERALGGVLVLYVPWYLFRAMRRVYEQGWWKTVPKYLLLGFAYLISLVFTGVGLLFYTALTL
jgi:hypothetical protein